MKYFIAAILLLISIISSAAIYMQTDSTGNVSYSDMPSPGAQRQDIASPPAMETSSGNIGNQPSANSLKKAKAQPVTEEHQAYTDFTITSPAPGETFQNQREIPLDIQVSPSIQKGDSIIIFLDGTQAGEPATGAHFTLHQVNRGTHQVMAKLINNQQAILKSSQPVTFYVHYAALGGGGS
jgi:hypothetical protein